MIFGNNLIASKLLIGFAVIILLGCTDSKSNGLLDEDVLDNSYTLMWEEDFDEEELDLSSWNYEYHKPGWVNNELQEYTDSDDNIYLEEGKLIIQALKKEVRSEVTYTSGRINTKDKHDYTYGKFEVRAKVPNGKGFLPAFWMMPTDENLYGQWPKCGEIDIMEVVGDETDTVHGTLHFGEPHTSTEGTYELVNGDFSSDFHVYSCEWEPNEIRFYVDGTLYYRENDWFTKREGFGEITYPAPYDQPFYLILNLAVGGEWPGNPKDDAVFAEDARFVIDYVKVYQKDYYDEHVSSLRNMRINGSIESKMKIIGDILIPEVEKSILPDGNYVYNGKFQEGPQRMKYWEVEANEDTKVSVTNSDNIRELKAEVSNANDISDVLVKQDAIALSKSKDYVLSFSGYADDNVAIKVRIANQTFDCELSTEQSIYAYSFTTGADIDLTELVFLLGQKGSISLDDVRITDDSLLINGDFSNGMVGYELYAETPTDVSYIIDAQNEDKAISITIKNTGDADWKIQLKQNNIQLIKGKSYRLRFDAKSTVNRKLMYALQRDGSSDDVWIPYSGTQIVALNNTYQTFTHEFTMEEESDPNTILSLSMGAVGSIQLTTSHDIVIANIQLEEIAN